MSDDRRSFEARVRPIGFIDWDAPLPVVWDGTDWRPLFLHESTPERPDIA